MNQENKQSISNDSQIATLGGGCFWCVEALYDDINGVVQVISGYSGGLNPNPTYEQVCTGTTGHAEVVQITFEPNVITYNELLQIFFTIHDPTTLDRQGADVGSQYRSIIFYHNTYQKTVAEKMIRKTNEEKFWEHPVVTQVAAFTNFYSAEDYHQDYYKRNPSQGYCKVVIDPKIAAFRKKYLAKLKSN